jgi:hypothetical protein
MIPYDAITEWAAEPPWPTRDQVEQDLLLSRAICEIAKHPYLKDELIFRGCTAFHKLHLDAHFDTAKTSTTSEEQRAASNQ